MYGSACTANGILGKAVSGVLPLCSDNGQMVTGDGIRENGTRGGAVEKHVE